MSEVAEGSPPVATIRVETETSGPRSQRKLWLQIWPRLVFVIVLASVAFCIPIVDTAQAVFDGSRTVYVLTAPLLVALIMAGYRHPPRGVGDAESDWIVAVVLGVGTLTALELVTRRLPTVAALWHLQNVQMVVWLIASSMVVFTVRHVARLWKAWLFAFACAVVSPYLLVVYQLGGSDTAAALLAVALSTLATFWATRFTRWTWRLAATTSNVVFGIGWVMMLSGSDLAVRVMIGAGAVPVLTILAMYRVTRRVYTSRSLPAVTTRFPQRHSWSYVVLVALSVLVLLIQLPHQVLPAPPGARPDWAQRMGLTASVQYPFIARFIGPGTTLTRYRVPNSDALPAAAIDVITAKDLAALRDFRDAVWYPHSQPVNYQRMNIDGVIPVQARSGYSNGDASESQDARVWYAITWAWHTGDVFQRVMVAVNQDTISRQYPPEPQPITFASTFVEPVKWILRQQPDSRENIDPVVAERAKSLVLQALAAGGRNG
jgi:hypothetical protein